MVEVREMFPADALETLKLDPKLPVVAIRTPKVGELSRKERDDIKVLFGERPGAKVFEDIKRLEKTWPDAIAKIRVATKAEADDLVVLVAGPQRSEAEIAKDNARRGTTVTPSESRVYMAAGTLRMDLAKKYADKHQAFAGDRKDANSYRFLWVTDFPMFEWDETEKRWNAAHHPFTSPHDDDMDKLESDPAMVRALAYDVVLNGTELGSGSIRIHRQDIQQKIFHALGMTEDEARSRFGFFLEALEYGTPPHGGIALGLDRIVMILAGADSLREVIPFPKTAQAKDLMTDAPTEVDERQLKELNIAIRKL